MRKIWATEIESTCPCCGGPVILTMDYDGMARWVHEIWKFCECPWDMGGVILDFTIDGFSHELLVKEGEPINA